MVDNFKNEFYRWAKEGILPMGVSDKDKGLYNKYDVQRNDGRSKKGQKHFECEYFVLDLTHDLHAASAITAYANSCAEEFPALVDDLLKKVKHITKLRKHAVKLDETLGRIARILSEVPYDDDKDIEDFPATVELREKILAIINAAQASMEYC